MENQVTQKEIGQYLEGVHPAILDLVTDTVWKKRVGEIAQKYALNEEQSTILHNLVLFTLIDVEEVEDLQTSIETELGISDLLTEQIMTDLDTRVFQYWTESVEEKIKNTEVKDVATQTSSSLPMIETLAEREAVVDSWKALDSAPESTQRVKTSVPRYVPDNLPGIEIETEEKVVEPPVEDKAPVVEQVVVTAKPQSVIDAKLGGTVSSIPTPKPVEEKPIVKQYVTDPYREPLE